MAHSTVHHRIQSFRSSLDRFQQQGGWSIQGEGADVFASLNALLDRFEREADENGIPEALKDEVNRALDALPQWLQDVAPEVEDFVKDLRFRARELATHLADSLEIPSRPLFGVLPIARIIPQDLHSVLDYSNGLSTLTPAFFADSAAAKVSCLVLGTSVIGVSALTDYRLSLANLIPIEVHEAIDYAWAASCIAAPFVFGYFRKSPITAAMHIAVGLMTIGVALITDYRAAKGAGRSKIAAAAMQGAERQPGVSEHLRYSLH